MRIGIDGIPLGGVKTGVGHYTFEVARGLSSASPHDEFQVVSHIPFAPAAVQDGTRAESNLFFIQEPVNSATKHWWTIGLPLYIRRNSIDLFHGTNYDVPVWGGCPTVLTIHDLSLLLYAQTHEQRRVRRARRRLPLMARLATRIIVPTESVRLEVCEHLAINPEKVVVIAEAPRRCFSPMSSNKARDTVSKLGVENSFILYVGTIEPRKNILTLVQAFEGIYKTTDLRPQLVIAGQTGWLSDDLFAYLDRSSIKDRLLLTGYLGDEDLRALYSTCSVMSYPALYEGAGLPPLEAMACGAPVITTDTGAIKEMVGDAARLISPRDHPELARQIVEVLTDPGARQHLIEKGLRRAAGFTWEQTAAATYKTYLAALADQSKEIESHR
jgi:glycosyltransferase involved in cell wall biosynthesis